MGGRLWRPVGGRGLRPHVAQDKDGVDNRDNDDNGKMLGAYVIRSEGADGRGEGEVGADGLSWQERADEG